MFSGKYTTMNKKVIDGRMFIDRNAGIFKLLVDYLRNDIEPFFI